MWMTLWRNKQHPCFEGTKFFWKHQSGYLGYGPWALKHKQNLTILMPSSFPESPASNFGHVADFASWGGFICWMTAKSESVVAKLGFSCMTFTIAGELLCVVDRPLTKQYHKQFHNKDTSSEVRASFASHHVTPWNFISEFQPHQPYMQLFLWPCSSSFVPEQRRYVDPAPLFTFNHFRSVCCICFAKLEASRLSGTPATTAWYVALMQA